MDIVSAMHSAYVILSCPVSVETHRHVLFLWNFHSHPAPSDQIFSWNCNGVKKTKFYPSFHFWVSKMCLDEKVPNQVLELKSDNIWQYFLNGRKPAQYPILSVFDRFRPKRGTNIIRFQFWDQIRNAVIKAHLLDTNLKGVLKILFWPPL